MEKDTAIDLVDDELERRRLQEYVFGLEEAQEKAEQLALEHERLRHSQELLVALLSGTIHGICLVRDDRFVWSNKAVCDILGWKQEELAGRDLHILFGGRKEFRRMQDTIQHQLDRAGLFIFEYEFKHGAGHRVPCLATGKALDLHDHTKGYVLSLTDITSRKQAEEALHAINEKLEQRVQERTAEFIEANTRLVQEIEARKRVEGKLRRGEEALRRQNLYLASLHETALGLMRRLDLGDLLQAILSRAATLVNTPDGFVYMYQSETGMLKLHLAPDIRGPFPSPLTLRATVLDGDRPVTAERKLELVSPRWLLS